ncbi:hypothetical protein QYE76_049566 [Lolium multiflorum]|uniref:Transposase (putative) gypsy type domain-containing protein n=1 Tax=Lolium multiflorum TaxID=4521 RepID=A0AAD8SN99_LOLMU|nr:hypothetical protein QYE76_049566 [Lolium multiflorum]
MLPDIRRLRRTHCILEGVATRLLGDEIVPVVNPGERVVFVAHFDRGLGLPASPFFRGFLEFFGLQPQHLLANAFVTLFCYVVFCDGYARVWPDIDFWGRLFYIKAQTTDVKNENPARDLFNLSEFSLVPPTKMNWGYCLKPTDPTTEVNMLLEFLRTCVTRDRLTGADLLCTFTSRRVLPLQWRVHKICYMSSWFDPTRTSKVALTAEGVANRVNHISQARLPNNWSGGWSPTAGRILRLW